MGFGYGAGPPYVPVAERSRNALLEIARLNKNGRPVTPVVVEGSKIATTFWGKAWCDNLEAYGDYANRLPRGRTYVRNGSVIDPRIGPREVTAKVSGSEIYSVRITITALPAAAWKSICADCAGRVASFLELLRGRLSKAVMDRVCRQGDGLFPKPAGIRSSCSCPDSARWANMWRGRFMRPVRGWTPSRNCCFAWATSRSPGRRPLRRRVSEPRFWRSFRR